MVVACGQLGEIDESRAWQKSAVLQELSSPNKTSESNFIAMAVVSNCFCSSLISGKKENLQNHREELTGICHKRSKMSACSSGIF